MAGLCPNQLHGKGKNVEDHSISTNHDLLNARDEFDKKMSQLEALSLVLSTPERIQQESPETIACLNWLALDIVRQVKMLAPKFTAHC